MKKLLASAALVILSLGAHAAPVTETFNYTGAAEVFNVPPNVTSITIEARGAQGGAVSTSPAPQGGLGATMIGTFAVSGGQSLSVVVGGRGNSDVSSSGGGGGSGVSRAGTPLIVAGGGAGVDYQDPAYAGQHAVVATSGVIGGGSGGAGGVAGGPGGNNIYSGTNISQGGNGFNDGASGSVGLNGITADTTQTDGSFGLGGGGGSVGEGHCNCGGGGGGYSGGGSGQINNSGGGGGSFNDGTNQQNTAGNNSGNGVVIITYDEPAAAPVQVPTLSFWALLLLAITLGAAGLRTFRRNQIVSI
jgi:IPTL-CTERM motif